MDKEGIKNKKNKILCDRQKDKDQEKTQRQLEIKCFWTYPFGHVWPKVCINDAKCLVCGKEIYGLGDPY